MFARQLSEGQLLEYEQALRDIIAECDDGSKDPVERLAIIRYTAKAALLEDLEGLPMPRL